MSIALVVGVRDIWVCALGRRNILFEHSNLKFIALLRFLKKTRSEGRKTHLQRGQIMFWLVPDPAT